MTNKISELMDNYSHYGNYYTLKSETRYSLPITNISNYHRQFYHSRKYSEDKLPNLILQWCYLVSKKVTRIGDFPAKMQRTNITIYLKDETILLHGYFEKKVHF